MISENAKYWVWVSLALGVNTPKAKAIYERYDNIRDFYEGGDIERVLCGIFTPAEREKFNNPELTEKAKRIVSRCAELGYSVVTFDDSDYPKRLYETYSPPAALYVNGKLPDFDSRFAVGIVGSRAATQRAKINAYEIGYALGKYGVVTVSGGAMGVDSASHHGTLKAEGTTVCVLGCGINYPYLKENKSMRDKIIARGALVSEYPPDTPPVSYHFPMRNRIIAALSNAVVIIESAKKSGSLITADYAGEMGRDVFAVMGENNPKNEGSNERIKDGTAIPITSFADILMNYDNLYLTTENVILNEVSLADIEAIPSKGIKNRTTANKEKDKMPLAYHLQFAEKNKDKNKPKRTVKNQKNNNTKTDNSEKTRVRTVKASVPKKTHKKTNLTGNARIVYEYINETPMHIDKIANDTGIPVFKLLPILTQLEIKELISAEQGRMFVLK